MRVAVPPQLLPMAPAKLTDQDKQTIPERYRQPGVTAADLAAEFGVSSSTISRILRTGLDAREYERLQWLKRQTSATAPDTSKVDPQATAEIIESAVLTEAVLPAEPLAPLPEPRLTPIKRRSASSATESFEVDPAPQATAELEGESVAEFTFETSLPDQAQGLDQGLDIDVNELAAISVTQTPEEFAAYGDEFDLGSDEDDGEEGDATGDLVAMVAGTTAAQVLPLANAQLPRVLYLVVDRLGDLVTCPLSSFPELGWIASDESEAQVLPLFDNHRVAKRFCKRSQKVLKVPDSRLLGKTQQRLVAKGICRFLLDGNLYALN
jgi:transposase-like protein